MNKAKGLRKYVEDEKKPQPVGKPTSGKGKGLAQYVEDKSNTKT